MAEASSPTASERIDRALARIETAAAMRDAHRQTLEQRHEMLRTRMAEAIATLDSVIEREG